MASSASPSFHSSSAEIIIDPTLHCRRLPFISGSDNVDIVEPQPTRRTHNDVDRVEPNALFRCVALVMQVEHSTDPTEELCRRSSMQITRLLPGNMS